MRYKNTDIKNDKEGFRAYSTTYYPSIPVSDSDVFIVSKDSARLDLLAYNYYGDRKLWWVIAQYNKKPTEQHLSDGDPVKIPFPLAIVLKYIG